MCVRVCMCVCVCVWGGGGGGGGGGVTVESLWKALFLLKCATQVF